MIRTKQPCSIGKQTRKDKLVTFAPFLFADVSGVINHIGYKQIRCWSSYFERMSLSMSFCRRAISRSMKREEFNFAVFTVLKACLVSGWVGGVRSQRRARNRWSSKHHSRGWPVISRDRCLVQLVFKRTCACSLFLFLIFALSISTMLMGIESSCGGFSYFLTIFIWLRKQWNSNKCSWEIEFLILKS